MCRIEKWNTRTLHQKIQSMLYERTALSKKPDKLIATELKKLREEDKLTPDLVFRDRHPHVATYWTKTLPKDLLRKKLHQAVATARALIGERKSAGENPT